MKIDSDATTSLRFSDAKRRNLASWAGTLGLASVALGLGASSAAVNIGFVLLLLGSALVLDDIVKSMRITDPLLALLLTAFLLFVTLWATLHSGVDSKAAWGDFRILVKIAGLPSLAAGWWLLHGHLKYHQLLILLALGILIGCFNAINIEMLLQTPFAGKAVITDLNPNELGFLAAILFIVSSVSLLLDKRSKTSFPGSSWHWNLLFIITASLSGYLAITSQSKSIIIGICTAMVSVFFVRIMTTGHKTAQQRRRYGLVAISTLVICGLIALSPLGGTLVKRFEGFSKSLYMLPTIYMKQHDGVRDGDRFKFPHDSNSPSADTSLVGYERFMMWEESIFLLNEAPLIGHGPGTTPGLLAKSSYTEIRRYKHFHSLWFQLLVVLGTIGTFGFAALFIGFATRSGRDAAKLDRHISWSALGLWIYFFVTTLAQLRINHPSGQAFVILVGGMSYYCAFDRFQNRVTG